MPNSHSSRNIIVAIVIILLVIAGWWYFKGSTTAVAPVPQGSGATNVATPPAPVISPTATDVPNPTDTSDASINQDLSNIDGQIGNLNTDVTNANSTQ